MLGYTAVILDQSVITAESRVAKELMGKIAIVTGGANGIGRATVKLFVEEGAKVVIADLDSVNGEELAAQLGSAAVFQRTDVTDVDSVQATLDFAVRRFGGLNVIFNNAGIAGVPHGRFADDDLRDFAQVMAVNLLGVMLGTQRAARHMAKNGGGSIINTGSSGGTLPGFGVATYRASKAAVNHFTKCAAIEYAEFGIRVNCINPHAIPTNMTVDTPDLAKDVTAKLSKELSGILMARQPLKRQGRATDIANAALYLASDRSAQVTGQQVSVDGGYTVGDTINYADQMNEARKMAVES